ncbi:MAG: hypothetical protein M3044_06970 [Thermoproteota archaeon]|nr:hypothetical protein [Thermoproteota archaeon]
MKELRLTYLATFLIVALFLFTVPSGLFHASPQNVLAGKILTGVWNKNSLQYLNHIHKNKLWLKVLPISDSNSISDNNTLLSSTCSRPSINISDPTDHHTILTNFIIINSTTFGAGGGIQKSNTADRHHEPSIPIRDANSSIWSFPIVLQETGSYAVKPRVTDYAGYHNWADVAINYVNNKRIAFVEPTFTYAAYRNGSFYNFYEKYSLSDTTNKTITADLNLLKNRPIPHGPFPYYAHPTFLDIPYIDYFKILLQHVKNKDPFVTNITDVDVHQGKIFQTDGRNAYDVLFLFHNEYATQSEYNNLRQFVSNGGTIVFTEANTLFAEVSYNKTNDSITLVKGHYWMFDGKSAIPSVSERWLNENKEWMGSNFFDVPSSEKVHFRNNPFNYTHTEEQYVTNPEAKILINYQAYDIPSKSYQHATVATYQMNYGKGKVINLGIWGHIVEDNKAFLNYFDNVIIPLALGPNDKYELIPGINF